MNFQLESVETWSADCMPLVVDHWKELGLDLDLEIAPDFEKMAQLESMGMFKVITARQNGELCGYLLAVVNTHLHYKTSPPMFIVDAYYIKPYSRLGAGARLFCVAESVAKQLGCIKIYASFKLHKNHEKFFTALGYRMSDAACTKRI